MNFYKNFYENIQNKAISIWKRFKNFDFKKEIETQKFSFSLYSKILKNKNYFGLGCFNYIIDLCSNIYSPNNLTINNPNVKNYIEYIFRQGSLKIVKHKRFNERDQIFFILDEFIFQLSSSYELSCIWYITNDYQLKISQCGIYVEYISKISINKYRLVFCDLFSFTETIYDLKNNVFCEKETINKILKPFFEIVEMNIAVNPFPFSEDFLLNGIKLLKNGGYYEI